MMWSDENRWSHILNFIIHTYLQGTTVCIMWHENYAFQPQAVATEFASFVGIYRPTLARSFESNVVDVASKIQQLQALELPYDDLLLKLTLSIEASHCESFIVFGADIVDFVAAFEQAAMYSIWRSLRNKFVFAHVAAELEETCCRSTFFQDQPNILFVVRNYANASRFELKTNKYVGPRVDQPAQLLLLDLYDAQAQRFQRGVDLFPDKLRNLQGREVTIAGFEYKPYTVILHDSSQCNARDVGVSPESDLADVYVDGTEVRVVLNFCAQFNCTVQIDSSDADDWGTIYSNISGDGTLGMVLKHKADISVSASYSWYEVYIYLDMSMYLVRSGITCLVPAPMRLVSWYLPLEPFQATLWTAVLLCLLLETLGLMLAHKSEQELYSTAAMANWRVGWWRSAMYGLATTLKLFISQSSNNVARSATVRVLLFACFLIDIIITSIYGGGLSSILTIPSLEEAADSVERLRTHHLPWAGDSEAWVMAIRGSEDELVQELLNNFHIYSDEELTEMALNTPMGFTVERLPFGHFAIFDFLTPQAIDQMKIMEDDIYYQYTVAFVPRLWALLEPFNSHIYRWHSSGFDKYWEGRIVAAYLNRQTQEQVERTSTSSAEDIGPVKLGMSNIAGIVVIWVMGASLAALVFLVELLLGSK